jgi:hypothetical protein
MGKIVKAVRDGVIWAGRKLVGLFGWKAPWK